MRRLIINADDFGLTAGVNLAIAEAHRCGVVTAATLMANARAFNHAVVLAKAHPELAVGCHVVLVDGAPVLPPEQVRTLAGSDGKFRTSLAAFASAALRGGIAADEITAEATAQIRKLQQAGLAVSHLDAHKHAHIFPPVLRPLLAAARACGVRGLRNPFTPAGEVPLGVLARRPALWKRSAQVALLRRFSAEFRRRVTAQGMVTPDGAYGIVTTGKLDTEVFRDIVAGIPDGTWELVCHPGYDDAELAHAGTRLRAARAAELRILTVPETRVFLQEQGIELISYRDLVANVAV